MFLPQTGVDFHDSILVLWRKEFSATKHAKLCPAPWGRISRAPRIARARQKGWGCRCEARTSTLRT